MRTFPLCLIALAAAAAPAWAQDSPAGDAGRGKALYLSSGCWQCHGTTGAGGGWQGPKLAPDPPPFDGFAAQLRHPARSMPPYRQPVLSDKDVADIHAYLAAIPRGKTADQIDILSRR